MGVAKREDSPSIAMGKEMRRVGTPHAAVCWRFIWVAMCRICVAIMNGLCAMATASAVSYYILSSVIFKALSVQCRLTSGPTAVSKLLCVLISQN